MSDFAKGIKKEIIEPVIIEDRGKEVDRFNGVWRVMKVADRELLRIAFNSELVHKAKALKALEKTAEKGAVVTDDDIQAAWRPINKKMDDHLAKWLIRGETDDDRTWSDDLLIELLEIPHYRDGLFAALNRLADGEYYKDIVAKNS